MRPPSPSLIVLLLLLAGAGVLPLPQQDAAPPLALPLLDSSSGPSTSNRLAVPNDLDRPSPAPPPASIHGGRGSRTLKSSNAAEQGRFLLASLDGTIYSVDPVSRIIQWKLATGSPLWHSEQALSNNDGNEYFIFPGEEWDLYEHRKDIGVRKLNLTVEELVHNMPEIKGSVVTIGSKTTSLYHVDADSGEVLYIDHLPGTWPAVGIRRIEEKPVSSKLDSDKSAITANNIITIVRTDYLLNSSNLGKPLWSMSTSTITASMSPSLGSKLELPPLQHIILPVIFFREAGNRAVPMLPPADVQNSMTFKQEPLDMPLLPEKSGIVASSRQNVIATSLSFESQDVTREVPRMQDDDPISLNTLQNLSKSENIYPLGNSFSVRANVGDIFPKFTSPNPLKLPYDNQTLFSTSQNSSKGANATKQNFTQMLPRVLFGVTSFLILLVLCYLKFRKTIKSDKQSSDIRGRQSVVPKKRKVRKAGNYKNGAIVSNHDKIASSEKGNAQTNGDTYIQNNERYPFTRADDANDGRRVGRLFVSNSEIGRGSNGTVVLEGVFDSRPVAVKRLLRAHHDVAFKEIQNLIASDRHPNIVRWYGVEQDLDFVYISLERCNCSLSDLIQLCSDSSAHPTFTESPTSISVRDHKLKCIKGVDKDLELWRTNGFPSSQLLKLMRDVVSGLAHLHELGIIHRDLKPQNVLISNDRFLNAKLSDMGISKRLLEDMSSLSHHATGYGSSGWQAPEQLLHGRQTRAVDLFSLGCILFFCITKGKHPFGSYFERDSNIVNNRVDLFLVDHIPEAVHLLSQLLDANPEMRPTAVEVFCHPFFWRSETRLSFLRDTSDRIELEDRANESELLKALENISSVAFGGRWGEKLDAAFIADMGRYRKYSYDCTRDLLRVIRNKLNHYRELPRELQENLGPVPDGFDRYFSSRFPNLLIEVYKVVSRHCREDDSFSKYFKASLV